MSRHDTPSRCRRLRPAALRAPAAASGLLRLSQSAPARLPSMPSLAAWAGRAGVALRGDA